MLTQPFMQLLSLGVLWIFFHCSAMCGPIVSGLNLNSPRQLFLYQAGRGIVYATAGFIAGMLGSKSQFETPMLGWLLVLILALMTLVSFFPHLLSTKISENWLRFFLPFIRKQSSILRPFILGALLGFLPCMLSLWALGLAASTNSGPQGALLMIILIALTTLPLLATSSLGIFLRRFQRFHFAPYLLLISTLWVTMVTLASTKQIDHLRVVFELWGRRYVLMFW